MTIMKTETLVKHVVEVMQGVVLHQRPRWGILLESERQYEGWWKAEMMMALEGWTWSKGVIEKGLGVGVEMKPKQLGLHWSGRLVDLYVGPWGEKGPFQCDHESPRVWIELKTRATWWRGGVAKALAGLKKDLEKWAGLATEGETVLVCQITTHNGHETEHLPKHWEKGLDEIPKRHKRLHKPFSVALPLHTYASRKTAKRKDWEPATMRWVRLDCFLVGGP